jgi:hypothetical protein
MNKLRLLFLMFFPLCSQAQPFFYGNWKIVNAKNTLLELGVASPSIKDFSSIKRKYLGGRISFHGTYFLFSSKLKNTSSYSDTVFIGKKYLFLKKEDTELTREYPGDELNCDSIEMVEGKCFVGTSFMKLLGSKSSTLTFFDATGNFPDKFKYKLCVVEKNKIGLLCENSNVLLILRCEQK